MYIKIIQHSDKGTMIAQWYGKLPIFEGEDSIPMSDNMLFKFFSVYMYTL